jgi:hypothetical protein
LIHLTDAFFDGLRHIGDARTDEMVDRLIQNGQIKNTKELLKLITHNNDLIPSALPEDLELWLRETSIIPAWVDAERVQRARDFFHQYGLVISLILSTAALIDCFAGKKGVKVLVKTGILQNKTYIRLIETAQFVFNIMEPDGLEPKGKGIIAIQKVRLMHTVTRRLIMTDQKDPWDQDELGIPICQEDLLGTLMSFTTLVFDCMNKLDIKFSEKEAEDYYYIWRMIAEMLGIQKELIPVALDEARRMMSFIAKRQFGPSADGIIMTHALIKMFDELIPGHIADGHLHEFIRHLVGDEVADWMEIPRLEEKGIFGLISHLKFFTAIDYIFMRESYLNKLCIDLILKAMHFEQRDQPLFVIPTQLRNAWAAYDYSAEAEAAAEREEL